MVALLISHVELHTPAKAEAVVKFYADALGGARADNPRPEDSSILAINVGVSQLHLRCLDEGQSEDVASLFAEAMGSSTPSAAASSASAEEQPLAGHVEVWTTEPLDAVAARLAAVVGDDGPELFEDADPRVVCFCPWGHKLLVRPAPEQYSTRGCLQPMGTLGAVSRLVLGVRKGHAAAIRSFFVGVLGSACNLRHAGNAEVSISFAVAPLGSGQQIIFEERHETQCVPLVETSDGRLLPRTTRLAIYIQSREAFRVAFLAVSAAGLLVNPYTSTWDDAEHASAFAAHLQAPHTAGDAGGALATGIELELRSITHPACPQGTGRRCGAGRMMGGFGAPARELSSKSGMRLSERPSSNESAASAANRRKSDARRPPQAPKSPGGSGRAATPPVRPPAAPNARAASPAAARRDASRASSPRRSPKADKAQSPAKQSMVHRQLL